MRPRKDSKKKELQKPKVKTLLIESAAEDCSGYMGAKAAWVSCPGITQS